MISIKQKLSGLPADKVSDLELITQKIVDTGLAEIVILYGSYARGDYKDENIIEVGGSLVLRRSDYDILVIIDRPKEERKTQWGESSSSIPKIVGTSELEIQNLLSRLNLPVQVIVEQIYNINTKLKQRHYFFLDINREGIVLYDSGKCGIVDPPEKISPESRRIYAEEHFKGWFDNARVNFSTSEMTAEKGQSDSAFYKQSAFQLEQACEMCYKCVLLVYTHYAPDEHNLYKLRYEAERYEPLLKNAFTLDTEDMRAYFEKLNLAYIGARYINSFKVRKEEINVWSAETKKILDITKNTCKIKIQALKKLEQRF